MAENDIMVEELSFKNGELSWSRVKELVNAN